MSAHKEDSEGKYGESPETSTRNDNRDGFNNFDDANINNSAVDGVPSMSGSPFMRSISQISQRPLSSQSQRSVHSTVASRKSSPGYRNSSHRSVVSPSGSKTSNTSVTGKKQKSRSLTTIGDGTHQVTFTVTVAAAVPAVPEEDTEGNKKSKRVVSDPKAQAFYHVEYYLLPTDIEPNKVDITLFGIAAKIYPEKQDAKVMKTWTEGSKTWIAWAHSHVVNVTTDLLKKLCYHKLVVRIWDTRDKFNARARFDRPRAFKFPPPKPGEDLDDISGVKTIIGRQSKTYIKKLSKNSKERSLPVPFPSESKTKVPVKLEEPASTTVSKGTTFLNPNEVPCLLLSHPDMEFKTYTRLRELAKLEATVELDKILPKSHAVKKAAGFQNPEEQKLIDTIVINAADPFANLHNKSKSGQKSSTPTARVKKPGKDRKAEQLTKEAVEYAKKHGVCSVHVPMGPLLIARDEGQKTIVCRLVDPVKTVLDAFVSVSIDKDLLSEQQRAELNPMSITLLSVKSAPADPIGFEQLQARCHPCTLSYKFFMHDEHKTRGCPQAENMHWDDLNVILLGPIPRVRLFEYLQGAPMEIQIHDRDKLPKPENLQPTLFGNDAEDERISNVGYVSGRRTRYNALSGRPTSWDPYGTAKLNMSDLLLGQRVLHLQIPVQNCPVPDVLGRSDNHGKVLGISGSVDGPSEPPMLKGNYIDSHTTLKVKVELAVPLVTPEEVRMKPDIPISSECPFARLVYILDIKEKDVATDILDLVSEINAAALGLDNLSPVVLDAALSTYKLSSDQQINPDLDIVTGFQVMDGSFLMFILEGLRKNAIEHIWSMLTKPRLGVTVLYNSDLAFSERLYGALDVDLTRIKLHEGLSAIVQHALLFVRDMVPVHCFKALTKLDQMTRTTSLSSAVRNDLFPSSDQVISMSREFGVPLTAHDLLTDGEKLAVESFVSAEETKSKSAPPIKAGSRSNRHLKELLDNQNPDYIQSLASRQFVQTAKDFLQDNVRSVDVHSQANAKNISKQKYVQVDDTCVHNYSTQTYNSVQLATDLIRESLGKDTLYTYNPEFHHSHTFVPVNIKRLKQKEIATQQQKRMSNKDWSFPGVRNLRQCNEHDNRPDPARTDALKEEWIENANFTNKLNPTLDRDIYSWIDRKLDMDTWSPPADHFEPLPEPPHSIMLPGQRKKDELLAESKARHEIWESKLVVGDTHMHFHRCNPQTEQICRGAKASDELTKLEFILRDPPKKLAFKHPRMRTEIPPLRVVHYPGVDRQAREAGVDVDSITAEIMKTEGKAAFKPGPFEERSWSLDRNRIPIAQYDINTNGYFNVYHNMEQHNKLYKRPIVPLTETEYNSHLFEDEAHSLPNRKSSMVVEHQDGERRIDIAI